MKRNILVKLFATVVTVVVTVMFVVMTYQTAFDNEGKELTTFAPQGKYASTIQNLVNPVFIVALVIGVLVMGAVGFIAWKFRDTGDEEAADEIPGQLHGNTTLEITWTLIPAAILLVIAVGTVATIRDLNAAPAPGDLKVKVEGQQWWWRFIYDTNDNGTFGDEGDVITANELVIPTGRTVELTETSNDVIHSFWIPALNGKKDAVPGMTTNWKLQADAPGVYRGQCTEFCGLSHANMRMLVRALPQTDFDAWYANQQQPARTPEKGSEAAAGMELFKGQLCSSCHLIRGVNDAKVADPEKGAKALLVSGVAPDLTHFATRGTFAGSIFNSRYPNPNDGNQPFGQTCQITGEEPGADLAGKALTNDPNLPACPPASEQASGSETRYGTAAPGNPSNPPDKTQLYEWLRDPPKVKPMAADPAANPDGKYRGMPNLKLTPEQITLLIAYLNSLT